MCCLFPVCQVKTAFDHASRELAELKASLAQSQQQEQKSVALVQELTTMVREQKDRIAEVTKSRKEAITDLKVWNLKTLTALALICNQKVLGDCRQCS